MSPKHGHFWKHLALTTLKLETKNEVLRFHHSEQSSDTVADARASPDCRDLYRDCRFDRRAHGYTANTSTWPEQTNNRFREYSSDDSQSCDLWLSDPAAVYWWHWRSTGDHCSSSVFAAAYHTEHVYRHQRS